MLFCERLCMRVSYKANKMRKDKLVVCPACGSQKIATYLYGLPIFSSELQKELDEGKLKLGGCDITEDVPDYSCNDCGKDF